ncbi:hypothetical protein ACFSO0_15690 [Brevibacillus sp. GCM10020057]|uniref:hypothetical protein n=1 Tax=Brevibacillus sp. GCM10020057 TaxID=3317327 RepID=UPI003633A671
MWTCPYCGGNHGLPFHDDYLDGMLCLSDDCGRFVEETMIPDERTEWDYSDL